MMDSKVSNALDTPKVTNGEIVKEQVNIFQESIFEIHNDPVMQTSLDLLTFLGKHKEITLWAKGDSISNAVTVALIITESIMKGNSKIHKVTVGSEPIKDLGSVQSNIKIILRKI